MLRVSEFRKPENSFGILQLFFPCAHSTACAYSYNYSLRLFKLPQGKIWGFFALKHGRGSSPR